MTWACTISLCRMTSLQACNPSITRDVSLIFRVRESLVVWLMLAPFLEVQQLLWCPTTEVKEGKT